MVKNGEILYNICKSCYMKHGDHNYYLLAPVHRFVVRATKQNTLVTLMNLLKEEDPSMVDKELLLLCCSGKCKEAYEHCEKQLESIG